LPVNGHLEKDLLVLLVGLGLDLLGQPDDRLELWVMLGGLLYAGC
jgi:hypothetical protein